MKTKLLNLIWALPVVALLAGCTVPSATPAFNEPSGNTEFPAHDGYRIYAVDNTGWDALVVYMYGTANNLGGSWPGVKSSGKITVKGKEYTYFNVAQSAAYGNTEKLIFNNGGNKQIPSSGEPSLTFGKKADYFFTVTDQKATAFDGGSKLEIVVSDAPVDVAPKELFKMAAQKRDAWNIYQVNPKLYGSSGAFGKIKDRLDDIKALGTDVFYLMPVYEQGKQKAIGSPYCVKDFKAVNTSYGTLADLKALVDAAHEKGMKVMFDWVANHTAWDCSWTSEHKDWYAQDSNGNILHPTADGAWTDVAQLDYSSEELCEAMTDALLYWVKELDIDGYRCDYAHGPTGRNVGPMDAFWKKAISALKELKPGFIMLAESDFSKMYDDGFDHIFSRNAKSKLVQGFAAGNLDGFFNAYKSALEGVSAPKCPLFFITNHDDATESSPVTDFRSKEGALAAFTLMRSLNTATMIYGSQEVAYGSTINFFNTQNFNWTAQPEYFSAYKTAMSEVGKLDRGAALTVYSHGGVGIVSYEGSGAVVVNAGAVPANVTLPSGIGGGEKLTLDPYSFKVYQ
ncbi:MAG: starch-binding protein [Bacteroidales bacterium]|nr:starch-binding protein [Bacteroidales bacterium]